MAFADPQSITVNAVPVSMPRTGFGDSAGQFTSADGNYQFSVSHSYGKRMRRVVRVQQKKTSADPLIPSQNVASTMGTYLVVDHPVNGFTVAEQKYLVDALVAYLTASSGAKVTQLLGGEV